MIGYIISLVITGLVVGALARLVIPGPNPMGMPATIGIGIVGALIGGLIAGALNFPIWLAVVLEIAVAALLVYLITARGRTTTRT